MYGLTGFDKLADDAHRKYHADLASAEDIARAVAFNRLGKTFETTGINLMEAVAEGVRMARGEAEIG